MVRISALAEVGAIEGGGVNRLALSDEDRRGCDLVVSLMRRLGLEVSIDGIGNVLGVRGGTEPGPPVITGSHIDSVKSKTIDPTPMIRSPIHGAHRRHHKTKPEYPATTGS